MISPRLPSTKETFKSLQKELLLILVGSTKKLNYIYRRKGLAFGRSPKDPWGIGLLTNLPQRHGIICFYSRSHPSRSDQCQILMQIICTIPTMLTWAGWDTTRCAWIPLSFILEAFWTSSAGQKGNFHSYILPPAFMLKVSWSYRERNLY